MGAEQVTRLTTELDPQVLQTGILKKLNDGCSVNNLKNKIYKLIINSLRD